MARRTSPELTEDLTAEVFVRAFRRRALFRDEHGSALPWLLGIANNLIADHRRAERRRPRMLERVATLRPVSSETGVGLLAADLVAELLRLPAADRDPLLLVVWGELGDVGTTPPRLEELHARVSSAIAEEIERESVARRRRGFPRLTGILVPAAGVLVVALVAGVFLGLRGSGPSRSAPSHSAPSHSSVAPSLGSFELVYQAYPTPLSPTVTRGALDRTVQIMQARVRSLGVGSARVSVSGPKEITVILPKVRSIAEVERAVGTTAQLSFYDWEANVLTPNGKTVASQLLTQNPAAVTISQGAGGNSAPGNPGSGSMALYQAVQLAAKQRGWSSPANSRIGSQYWMFGAPGSAACATAARAGGIVPATGQHCLLSGPDDSLTDLRSGLPFGVSASEGQTLSVPRGWTVLQAIAANFSHPTPIGAPDAQFFVLKDNIALRGSDITDPEQAEDANTGAPEITFGLSSQGKKAFENMTAQIARRGGLVSGLGQSLNQHFAVVLDDQLITVPFIDYKQYPDGVNGDSGGDITGSFTTTSAQELAYELRLGATPLNLKLTCENAPATTLCHSPRVR